MSKVVLLIFIIALFSCSVKKQNEKTESDSKIIETKQTAQIEFDAEMHDFGKIKSGEILTFSFVFKNTGETDLIICNTETDCGCVHANIPEKTVKPGEKGLVEVEFNSAGLYGKQLKTLEIQSNSKEPKHLIIFAEVENELFENKN